MFGLRHVISGYLKKGEVTLIAAQNEIDPASLAVLFLDMFFNQFSIAIVLLHVTHTCLLFFIGVISALIS